MVFAWPGVGRAVVDAVFARDFPVVQAGVVLAAVVFVVVNLIVDLSYGFSTRESDMAEAVLPRPLLGRLLGAREGGFPLSPRPCLRWCWCVPGRSWIHPTTPGALR